MRRVEHARRMHPRRERRKPCRCRSLRFRACKARAAFARGRKGRHTPCDRHRGIRPRARRRSCDAFCGVDRRRAGHRKIDAAFADGFSRGESERQCDARTLRVGRRIRRADKRAERTARPRCRRYRAFVYDASRRYARRARCAKSRTRDRRLDSNDVFGAGRFDSGNGQSIEILRERIDKLGQRARRRFNNGRARDERRVDRRPEIARAHGRHGGFIRTQQRRIPLFARGKKQVRLGR